MEQGFIGVPGKPDVGLLGWRSAFRTSTTYNWTILSKPEGSFATEGAPKDPETVYATNVGRELFSDCRLRLGL